MPIKTTYSTAFGNFIERNCSVCICLDIRKVRKNIEGNKYPLALRFNVDAKRLYHHIGGYFSKEEFSTICNVKKNGSEKYAEQQRWKQFIEEYSTLLRNLNSSRPLSLDIIKVAITGKSDNVEESFLGIWQELIDRKVKEGFYSTGESYECALKSFKKIMGENAIKGFLIGPEDIAKWNDGMKNGIKVKKQLVGKIADTTRGIYLRTCRMVWNECRNRGFLTNVAYPFSNKMEKGKIAIPKSATRKSAHLDVEKMTELYNVFINKQYPTIWSKYYTGKVHFSVGLFLAQYLCNGFNLADAGELTYDNYYYATGGKAFRFERRKTRNRSGNGSEVIIPIIEPLQRILDEIAAKPKLNTKVFPDILKGYTDPENIRKQVCLENSNVQDRLIKLCEDGLKWEVRPSSTWARHSFANNLKDAGVEREYISESMGHSVGKDVTSIYLDSYPLSKQIEYNNKLLSLNKPEPVDVDKLTPEEMKAMLLKLLNK